MLTTSPAEQFEALKTGVIDQITRTFPVTDRRGGIEVRVKDVGMRDVSTADDVRGQAAARNSGTTWAAPVTGTLQFVDTASGKVLLEKPNHVLVQIPKMTRHGTYIVGGAEKTVQNQWRLRPGAYVKPLQKEGEFEAQFQLAKGKPFDLRFGPDGKLVFTLGSQKIPLYAVMKGLGVSDTAMRDAWGDKLFEVSKSKVDVDKKLRAFYSKWKGSEIDSKADAAAAVKGLLADTRMDAAVAQANLGVEHDHVSPEALLAASKKLLDVANGKARPDLIDSLRYKELWTSADHFADRIQKATPEIHTRIQKALEKGGLVERIRSGDTAAVREVVMPDLFKRPMDHVFVTSLASNAKQVNPLSMLSDRSIVTIMGPGGIQNEHQITESNTAVDPSHIGYVDPVFTPESNAGVSMHLTSGTRIVNRKPVTRLFNVRTGKIEDVDAVRAATSNVVLPDQVKWSNGTPSPVGKKIRMSDRHGDMRDDIGWEKADYVLLNPAQVFATETNLVPFIASDSPHRSTMSARHMGQAISIVGREAPLVQTEAGSGHSFEKVIGSTFLAHKAPVDGVVKSVQSGGITIQGKDGKARTVGIYDHYPLNHDKAMLHSTPLVKPGDKVKAGDLVAEHNFAKGDQLALGTNLRVAYLADGFNHEDGITISESAAQKLRSEHLYKPEMFLSDGHTVGKKEFLSEKGAIYHPEQIKHIGDDGIIKPGAKVKPGDPLILALSSSTKAESVGQGRQISRKLKGNYSNAALVWDSDYEGEVVRVNKKGSLLEVHVKTSEPAQVGSKLSTRHSAKGIVTRIIPDSEMPHDDKGRPVQMLINPVSVPGRMNPGQILETVAGKIAEKTGKPYVVKNFETGTDYLNKLRGELKKHGVKETERLTDPKTGRVLGDVTVGPHYVFQLEHQIDKKTHVRSGARIPQLKAAGAPVLGYDIDTRTPQGGGHHGAQSLGLLGTYGALAAGMRNNLREMQTLKSDLDQAQELWNALSNGTLIPAPKVPFAYKKFEAMLRGLGVNVEKSNNEVRLLPSTDAETRALSNGEIKDPTVANKATEFGDQPIKGGLYDRSVTGGPSGPYWGHIELVEPMPHPLHEKSIAYFLGIKAEDIPKVLNGTAQLPNGRTGPSAIKDSLAKLDVGKTLSALKKQIDDPKLKGPALDKANRAYKSMLVLQETGKHPKDAWTLQAVPVLPPIFRPQATLPDGTQRNNPLNRLYARLGMVNSALKSGSTKVPYNATLDARAGLYQEVKNLLGTVPKDQKAKDLEVRGTKVREAKDETPLKGILHSITGDSPKDGFFQDKLLGKKQDYTARVTIVADPTLSANEIGVPKKVALELFRPMVARRVQSLTGQRDPLKVHEMISKKDPIAVKALEHELEQRPVLLKRDPVLHQYGLIGQKVKLTNDAAVKVSPLVLPPIGGDIDGDAVVLSVPITPGAVEEVKRVMPEARSISGSNAGVLFKPANEAALSLYRMSIPRGDKTSLRLTSAADAEKAFAENKIALNDKINVPGIGATTLGRVRIANSIPEQYRKDVLTNLQTPFDSKYQDKVLKETARGAPGAFIQTADRLAQLGFKMAYESGHSVTLADLEPLKNARDTILASAEKEAEKLRAKGKEAEATQVWVDATKQIHAAYEEHYAKKPTNVSDMAKSGIKAKREQFQGLVMAPMLVEDYLGRPSKVPVTKSFAEGVDVGGYFMQAMGARRGLIQKTKSTAEPGYLTKRMVWAVSDQPITSKDCGTDAGILLSTKEKDVVDRHLAAPVTLAGKTYGAGTPVTPEMLAAAEKGKADKLLVRSPLKCRMPHGVCSKCMGLHPSGKEYDLHDNVGIISAQALGERAAQLMLKQTHGGGIMGLAAAEAAAAGRPADTEGFAKVERLLDASKPSPESATLAPHDGKVTKIEESRRGGWDIHLEGRKTPLYSRQKPYDFVRPGYQAKRGEQLTQGDANIHHILETKGLEAAQSHLTKEIGNIYGKEGILRRHVELLVRNTAGTVKVTDPGDHPHIVRGDHMMKPVIDEVNRAVLAGKEPIRYEPTLIAVGQHPIYMQKDWMARLQSERLTQSIATAAQQGQRSNLVGRHPIPGLAHGATFGTPPPPSTVH